MTATDTPPASGPSPTGGQASGRRLLKVLDQTRCIGCHACTTACKAENDVPLSVTRTYVKSVDVGTFPTTRRAFQVTRCNQCEDAPCVAACPTGAMFARPDGIVDFTKSDCIGCKACMAACPYDAIFINPEDHSAEKCNFCAHRLDIGLEPACVSVCPTQAILIAESDDPAAVANEIVGRSPVAVRRPEKGTRPKLFYRGATAATLDPLAAAAPSGDVYAWAEKPQGAHIVPAGNPGTPNSSAAAILSYDVAHRAPWDWRVSLYTWTKSIASGAYLAALLLVLTGALGWGETFWVWTAPIVATVLLALTAVVLVADLEHPTRFIYVLTKPQWRSWLVRGGIILSVYAGLLGLHLLAGIIGSDGLRQAVAAPGAVFAAGTAVYTAYLFAQAKARDLWQSPLLPPHLLVQAILGGAAVLTPLAAIGGLDLQPFAWALGGSAAVHLLLVAGEVSVAHPTAHAKLAAHAMTGGRYRWFFWIGVAGVGVALVAPWATALAPVLGVAAALGLLAHEHAYVQAGQSVPLA